ncbi:MFS transporter [Jatrophihabitans sp. DSM 45814]
MSTPPASDTALRPPMEAGAARLIVVVLAFSSILVSLMQTILVPLLGQLPHLFDTSASNASWAVTSTLLVAAIATPISGRLGDMYGKRRVLLLCLVLLTVGSIVVACTSQVGLVVLGRSLQGAASSILPLSIAILRDELPSERVPGAVALISASLGIGSSLGLPVAALVAQHYNWHLIFVGTAVLGAFAFVAVFFVVPESEIRRPGRFDVLGAIGLSTGLLFLLLVVSKGNSWGWTSPLVIGLAVAGVAVLLVWVRYETTLQQPLVDIRVSSAPPVLFTNAASVLAGFALLVTGLVIPQLLQAPKSTGYGLGLSMVGAGLCLAPSGLVQILFSPVSGRIVRRFGGKVTLILGLSTLTLGFAVALLTMSKVWHLVMVSIINGVGVGLSFASMPVLIMGAVPVSESAAANGLNTLSRAVGASVSSAVVGVLLASLTMEVGGVAFPTRGAFRLALVIGAVSALIGVALATFIPRPPPVAEALSLARTSSDEPARVVTAD